MSAALDRLAGFPLLRVAFAPVGTRLPRGALEDLDEAFLPYLVPEEPPEPVWSEFGERARIGSALRFQEMSLVLDVGMGEAVARLVLPSLRVQQHPETGSVLAFMFSPAMYRRWKAGEQQVQSTSSTGAQVSAGLSVSSGRPFAKGGRVYDPGAEVRNAAITARRAGMDGEDIEREVRRALVEEMQLAERELVVQRFRVVLARELHDLRADRLDAIAGLLAEAAESLAGEGVLRDRFRPAAVAPDA